MKRNQKLFSLLLILSLALALAGCGSSGAKDASSAQSVSYAPAAAFGSNSSYYAAEEPMEMESAAMDSAAVTAGSGFGNKSAANADARPMSEKVIYNGHVNLETTEFDAAIESIDALIAQYDGYLENSSVSGSNYRSISRGEPGARSASYTIRVPSAHFGDIMGALPQIGNVPYSETSSRNVTRDYYDVQSRLDAYKTQEARLLEMLSVAETVEDMLSIQRELTEVQYELDSLTGTLRYYDDQVGYSTIYLNVQEVRVYTPEPTITLSYRERMAKGFRESVDATVEFFTEFFLWFVTSLPWLVPLVAIVALVIALLRRIFSRSPERRARREARKAAKRARAEEKRRLRQEKKEAKKQKSAPSPAAPAPSGTESSEEAKE